MAKRQRTSASKLLGNARSYRELATHAVPNDTLAARAEPAFYLLICFSLELSLKAICLHAGMAENTVKSIGHDLHEAYLAAAAVGGVPRVRTNAGRPIHQQLESRSPGRQAQRHDHFQPRPARRRLHPEGRTRRSSRAHATGREGSGRACAGAMRPVFNLVVI